MRALFLWGCVLISLNPSPVSAEWWRDSQSIMGTRVLVELWHPDEVEGRAAVAAVMEEMRRVDREMSPFKEESALSRMNREAAKRPVEVSPELFELMWKSVRISELTGGAFDVTFASAGRQYDYRKGVKPDSTHLAEALPAIDYHHVEFDRAHHRIHYLHEGVYVDLGGIAKGYAVDRAIALLRARGITQAMVGAGGDTRIIGDRRGKPWVVGIRHPRKEGENAAVLPLADVAVSTSGDYERYFELDGVRYHHIIDPKTGDSARKVTSVTILGDEATTTDALSTSVFVLGVKEGLALVNRLPGIDAIIIDGEGRLHFSEELLRLTGEDPS
ncbi:MAG: FAD:protein FMN transferase [Gammaproteobacteria bacterium]|jgi:thiamine biosynthesis lipoprotein